MSWSVDVFGRPQAVAAKLATDLANIKCSEPEQSIKGFVGEALASALAAFPPGYAVKVRASGSQYVPDHGKPLEMVNNLSVSVEPMYGFVE